MPPNVDITTTTNQYLAPAWVDQILRDNSFLVKILNKAQKWDGSQMLFPIKYQKGVASVAFNGFDLLPITQQPVTVNMTFFPTFVATNVALAGSDLSVNEGASSALQTLKLMKVMMESRAQDAADDIGNFFQQDGTAFAGKAPMGLAGIVDDGTTLATYGGLSRATYPGLNATVTASGGTISLLKIRQLNNAITDGMVTPDMIFTDYNTWGLFEQLLMPYQRNNYQNFDSTMKSATGYNAMRWEGIEVMRDKKVPTGTFFELNTDFLKFYGLKWYKGETVSLKAKDIKGNVYAGAAGNMGNAFTWTGWINAYNMGAVNGFMMFGGQFLSTAPFRQGKLTGITSI